MPKIGLDVLKRIIREELERLDEGPDHDTASKQASAASKLLNAIDSFKQAVSEKTKAELGESMTQIEKVLNRIVASPLQYVDTSKPPVKKVTLKPEKTDLV